MLPELEHYAGYVYAAYGVAIAILIGLIVWSAVRLKSARDRLAKLEAEEMVDAEPTKTGGP